MRYSWSHLLLACLLWVGTSGSVHRPHGHHDGKAHAVVTHTTAEVTIPSSGKGEHTFLASLTSGGEASYCVDPTAEVCVAWGDAARLRVARAGERHTVSLKAAQPFKVCLDISGQHLYGGPIKTVYPSERSDILNQPYITADFTRYKIVQAVTERYWYTSSGLNVKVDPEVPLFLTQNKEELCFITNNTFPYSVESPLEFSYETCSESSNLREAAACFFKSYDKPVPPEQVIGSPIWSTWVEFKRDVSQERAIQFFNDIKKNKMRLSVMEIDDEWETCYGSQTFNKKFPDPKAMVDLFHNEGYLTTLWVHPFVGPGCASIEEYAPYLCKYPNGSVGITEWWNGKGAALFNFTDPTTVAWYQQRLVDIQKNYGFDSFKFDAGEAAYIPGLSIDDKSTGLHYPNKFTRDYVKAASKFGALAEVRVGSEAHEYKIMQRLQDTNSVWEAENWGLRSVIKSVLQLSLHGYGAIMPDMVGGNCYDNQPSKEMFIRWIQLNTFLPVIQFSLAPWKFDAETLELSQKFTELHYQYKDRIMKEFHDESHPVINPVWWISPEDEVAQSLDDEFLLGENLLVAPVVHEGAVSRDLYLPAGRWRDANTGESHDGRKWLRNYSAPLALLPYFERESQ